jgi:hypothetical protein
MVHEGGQWRPALSIPRIIEGIGIGNICRLGSGPEKQYGRELTIGTRRGDGRLALAPWLRRMLKLTHVDSGALESVVLSRLPSLTGGATVVALIPRGEQLVARLSFAGRLIPAWIDSFGRALHDPPERSELPTPCRGCAELPWCSGVEITTSPAYAWRKLGLIGPGGAPTRRGIIFSFFHHGEGLAVAAALEDESYLLDDLVFDLANLRAGARFAGDDSPFGGRLGALCQRTFERVDLAGYLEMGVPIDYGAGASEVVRQIVEEAAPRQKFLTETLRQGDLERALIEWRSLLRHIVSAPDYDWNRWRELKKSAGRFVESTEALSVVEFPSLTAAQRGRTAR